MLYPLHTVILDNSQVFGGVPCKAQLCNFSKWFFSHRFGVVPIWELWQFCYVRIGPPKNVAKFRISLKFLENGGLFHHVSVYCFTECHLYTTETFQWRMQFVLQCYFFEFRYLFWLVYKCTQLQAKRAKWTIWA